MTATTATTLYPVRDFTTSSTAIKDHGTAPEVGAPFAALTQLVGEAQLQNRARAIRSETADRVLRERRRIDAELELAEQKLTTLDDLPRGPATPVRLWRALVVPAVWLAVAGVELAAGTELAPAIGQATGAAVVLGLLSEAQHVVAHQAGGAREPRSWPWWLATVGAALALGSTAWLRGVRSGRGSALDGVQAFAVTGILGICITLAWQFRSRTAHAALQGQHDREKAKADVARLTALKEQFDPAHALPWVRDANDAAALLDVDGAASKGC